MINLLEHRVRQVVKSCTTEAHFVSCRGWILSLRGNNSIDAIKAHELMEFVDRVEANVVTPAEAAYRFRSAFPVSSAPVSL